MPATSTVADRWRAAPVVVPVTVGPAETEPVSPLVAVAEALPPPVTLNAVASPLRPEPVPTPFAAVLTFPSAATALVGPPRLTEIDTAQKQDAGRPATSTTEARTTRST
jgi:hypothetical protein